VPRFTFGGRGGPPCSAEEGRADRPPADRRRGRLWGRCPGDL